MSENNRLQLERDDANLRRAEAETLRDSFETRNEQSCERVKLLNLELKHLRNQVERTGVEPARLMIYVEGLKSANERSKAEVKELEEKIDNFDSFKIEEMECDLKYLQKFLHENHWLIRKTLVKFYERICGEINEEVGQERTANP